MFKISESTLRKSLKPYDIVTDKNGNVGFIQEVSVNDRQEGFEDQIRYAVNWLIGDEDKMAWFNHSELKYHCNLFVKIAESSCDPSGRNEEWVGKLIDLKEHIE